MPQRDIVVVGASAGGVHALRRLASALPAGFPAAVCVVLHIGARASILPELLSSVGPLPALHACSGQPLRGGFIYVAPPDHHLLVQHDSLLLMRGAKEHHARPAVDPLFRSAALAGGPRVIGVLLTGRLGDGAAGLRAIKDCGGLAIVQDPADADEPEMPRSALRAVRPDHCVPLQDIAQLLDALVREPALPHEAPPPAWLVADHGVSLGDPDAIADLSQTGSPSPFVCPECGGPLWESKGLQPTAFRCHTGHGFSLTSLARAQDDAAEQALWSAIRALQEKEALMRRIAALDRTAGDTAHASASEQQADRLREQAGLLQQIIQSG